MTAKEYAEKYAGREVRIKSGSNERLGRIVGYRNQTPAVIVEIYEYGLRSELERYKATNIEFLVYDVKYAIVGFSVHGALGCIERFTFIDTTDNNVTYTFKKCKICRQQAIKYGKLLVCQNAKCKANK